MGMLRGDESALIAAAAAGLSHAEIAAAAGVSLSTLQRRLRDPQILRAVFEARADLRREALGRLNTHVLVALERVRELVGHEEPHVALRAAGMLMSNAFRAAPEVEPAGDPAALDPDEPGDLT